MAQTKKKQAIQTTKGETPVVFAPGSGAEPPEAAANNHFKGYVSATAGEADITSYTTTPPCINSGRRAVSGWAGAEENKPGTTEAAVVQMIGRTPNRVDIYPNPATGLFYVSMKDTQNAVVRNSLGITFLQLDALRDGSAIDLSNYPPGVYIISFSSGMSHKLVLTK